MADLTITGTVLIVTPVGVSVPSPPKLYPSGEDLDQGVPVYVDDTVTPAAIKRSVSTDVKKAKSVGLTVAESKQGQLAVVANGGQLTLGSTSGLVASMQYVVSNNTGKVKPYCDLSSGEYVSPLFYVEQDGVTCTLNLDFPGVFRTTTTTTTTTTT